MRADVTMRDTMPFTEQGSCLRRTEARPFVAPLTATWLGAAISLVALVLLLERHTAP